MDRQKRTERSERKGVPRRVTSLARFVSAFVEAHGGDRPISSILVANNGLGAVKFMRSVRMWAVRTFGNDKAISLVAMATPEDIRINTEHIQLADQFVEVPGGTNNNNYANVRLIVQTAERAQVDAVWPGWGHASEDPALPAALTETAAGIRFLGPPSAAMAALGDKVGSTILAQAANVPTYPWSGTGVKISYQECDGVIPDEIYARACLQPERAAEQCRAVGYPIMLKASWGGGGKGIRKVQSEEEVEAVLKQVQGEVPGSPIFAMQLASRCRHLEVQLLCDMYGNVCSLYSRDCSLQRRHQKIVEEGPVLNVPPALLEEMEKSARALARSVGYVGAATVEYLYNMEEESYYFLELNPRLQVEHPVTEGITGVNLPACQVMVGMGIPLHRIPDIRALFNEELDGRSPIDFELHPRRDPDGYVVAVRITSENANDGFKPTSGGIEELQFRPTADVWGYFSVKSGGGIHEFSDSQFGHLFAKGSTRQEAIRSMVLALKEVKIRGEIRTTVDYIINMIQEPDFAEQRIHTAWLDARIAQQITAERPPWYLAVVSGAVVKGMMELSGNAAEYLALLKKGQCPSTLLSLTRCEAELVLDGVKYVVGVLKQGPHDYRVLLNGSGLSCVARQQADGGILLQVDGEKHVVYSEVEAVGIRLGIDSWTCLLANESDPSQVLAPSAGKLRRYLVDDGSHLRPEEPYAELEVMKMLMPLLAPAAGTVRFQLPEGAVLNCGDLIVKLDLDDPNAVMRAVLSEEVFPPSLGPPQVDSDRVDDRFAVAHRSALEILSGYERDVEPVVCELLSCLDNKDLAAVSWSRRFSVAQSRLPGPLREELKTIMSRYDSTSFDILPDVVCAEFPADALLRAMQQSLVGTALADRPALEMTLAPLISLAQEHQGGNYTRRITQQLLDQYLSVEEKLQLKGVSTEQDVVESLRKEYGGDLQSVLEVLMSRHASERKSEFVQQLLVHVVLLSPAEYRPQLRRLTALQSCHTMPILKKAQYLLEHSLLAELKSAVQRCLSGLDLFSGTADIRTSSLGTSTPRMVSRKATQTEGLYSGLGSGAFGQSAMAQVEEQKMAMLVEAPAAVDDALALLLALPEAEIAEHSVSAMDHSTPLGCEQRALVTYIRRSYHHQILREPKIVWHKAFALALWTFCDLYWPGVESHAALILLESLTDLKDGVGQVHKLLQQLQLPLNCGTCHIALTGKCTGRFDLFPEAAALWKRGNLQEGHGHDLFEQDPRVLECLEDSDPKTVSRSIQAAVQAIGHELRAAQFDCIGFTIQTAKLPVRNGYRWDSDHQDYVPQPSLRQSEVPVAAVLELSKLEHLVLHYSPSRNRQWHIYTAEECMGRSAVLKRLYLRGILHQIGATPEFVAASFGGKPADIATAVVRELGATVKGCLEELLRVQHGIDGNNTSAADWVHIFLALLPPVPIDQDPDGSVTVALKSASAEWIAQHMSALRRASVAQLEIKIRVPDDSGAWRIVVCLPTGHETGDEHVDVYREKASAGEVIYSAASWQEGDLTGKRVLEPYEALSRIQQKRLTARRHGTTYCYDFPSVFANALQDLWTENAVVNAEGDRLPQGPLVQTEEFGFEGVSPESSPYDWSLTKVEREMGQNNVGMVAWKMTLKPPEAPEGRCLMIVANDITFQFGAFGPKEDALFRAAVERALEEKLPVVYLAANSGARVGVAMDIKEKLRVEWVNPRDPSKGVAYLYLDDADYELLVQKRVTGSDSQPLIAEKNEKGQWVMSDVIGSEDGLGVECLSGSGAIAGVFSKAFQQGFTITLVSGRTVGIGAYLARLGRRCVQSNQPIILTGFQALNKLLGRDVYSSQLQLGGPRIMGANGVSHHVVSDDLEGIKTMLKWLSYTPCFVGGPPPCLPSSDPLDRSVDYAPEENTKLDPRHAIAGKMSGHGWISGLFDRGSWTEAQEGWAQTVVTGRARLGGIPVGVIAVETQTVFKIVPADPGMSDSAEQKLPQAGQVWFPDSALKTAQAMEEFDLERLPLIILANWRGFSGGQRDLYEGVLQAGSLIVENLRTYRQPVFVYLPPNCELRGGAWVVIDSQINVSMVEMYADPSARGGVLEPEGVVEIKFKKADLLKMMHRLDPELLSLSAHGAPRGEIAERERALLPVYHQVALQFAEMHDTPKRMHGKGIIRDIVPWRQARRFLGLRLRRRLAEEALLKQITSADPSLGRTAGCSLIQSWFVASAAGEERWEEDAAVQSWLASAAGQTAVATELHALRTTSASRGIRALLSTSDGTDALFAVLKSAMEDDTSLRARFSAL